MCSIWLFIIYHMMFLFSGLYGNATISVINFFLGIYWDKLSPEKLSQVKVLRELKAKIERETGQKLPSGPSEKLPPTAERRKKR